MGSWGTTLGCTPPEMIICSGSASVPPTNNLHLIPDHSSYRFKIHTHLKVNRYFWILRGDLIYILWWHHYKNLSFLFPGEQGFFLSLSSFSLKLWVFKSPECVRIWILTSYIALWVKFLSFVSCAAIKTPSSEFLVMRLSPRSYVLTLMLLDSTSFCVSGNTPCFLSSSAMLFF